MRESQFVILKLDKEEYGVNIEHVKEISEFREITSIPNAPIFIEGIINLRGQVTPVINLRKKFNLPEQESNRTKCRIIIVNVSSIQVGFVVDDASYVLTINESDIEQAPELVINEDVTYISGIAKVEDRMIVLIDLEKILKDDEKKQLKSI